MLLKRRKNRTRDTFTLEPQFKNLVLEEIQKWHNILFKREKKNNV